MNKGTQHIFEFKVVFEKVARTVINPIKKNFCNTLQKNQTIYRFKIRKYFCRIASLVDWNSVWISGESVGEGPLYLRRRR